MRPFYFANLYSMKVLSSSQIREADQYTMRHEPIDSIDLMERASIACVTRLLETFPIAEHYSIYCGTGNNGGDGLAIARLLSEKNIHVNVFLVRFSQYLSADNETNFDRLKKTAVSIQEVSSIENFHPITENTVIVDALVGTGLTRPLSGLLLDVVTLINQANCKRVAIDIPSGMFCDLDNSTSLDAIFKADITLSFEVPKLNFLLPSLHPYVGEWHLLDIGLDKNFLHAQPSSYEVVDASIVSSIIKKRDAFAHKGTFGHGLIVAGSFGKMGAAVLSSFACLKAGAGLVSAFIPSCGYDILQTAIPEVMVHCSTTANELSGETDYTPYSSIGLGPGIGQAEQTKEMVAKLINHATVPIVVDADALNVLGQKKSLLSQLPKDSILTPHLKEFERLFGKTNSCFERLQLQRKEAQKLNVYILLKGKNSSIACPDGTVYFNNTGNPGMATAGSGDVLTGILTALLCQSYTSLQSCILGAHIHGLAGDIYAANSAQESLTASDLIDNLGNALNAVRTNDI